MKQSHFPVAYFNKCSSAVWTRVIVLCLLSLGTHWPYKCFFYVVSFVFSGYLIIIILKVPAYTVCENEGICIAQAPLSFTWGPMFSHVIYKIYVQ